MIAYEDLVVALSSWRAGQGLAPSTVNFLSADTGSVDLALPVADPVELATSEIEALTDEAAIEEESLDYGDSGEDEVVAVSEAAISDEYAADSAPLAYDESEQTAIADGFAGVVPEQPEAGEGYALNYEDETAYSDVPAMLGDESDAADSAALEASAEDEQLVSMEVGEDELEADNMAVEEEILDESQQFGSEALTEEVEALVDGLDENMVDNEGPTKFGDLDSESTVMGIGVDELQGPGPGSDPEDK